MIRREHNGAILSFTLPSGEKFSRTMFDQSGEYVAMLETEDAEFSARLANVQSKNDYLVKLSNYQINLNAGRGETTTVPVKPKMQSVSDPRFVADDQGAIRLVAGTVTEIDFNPPLPDPIPMPPLNPAQGMNTLGK